MTLYKRKQTEVPTWFIWLAIVFHYYKQILAAAAIVGLISWWWIR